MASYQSVNVYVFDDTPARRPVEGMIVRVFDESNINFFGQDTTDAEGRVGFTLWTRQYNLRFYKFGAQVKQPLRIEVTGPPDGSPQLNEFEATATVFVHPIATDSRLCRASGFFRDITGAEHPYLDIHFIGAFDPILLEGAGVVSERRSIRTDKHGYACIDLIRGACYTATLEGFEDVQRQISVPDSPSVNLPDLLFPVVEEVTFDPAGPISVAVGADAIVVPTVIASNQVPLVGTASSDVRWYSSSESTFSVAAGATELVIRGLSAGSASLLAERTNKSIIRVPNTPILGVPLVVNVA